MSTTLIDAIIVTYNSSRFIKNMISGIKKIIPENHIYIFDNNSTDDTIKIIERYYKDVNLYISDSNIGFAKAVNTIVKKTKKPYILLINPDTKPNPTSISTLLECLVDQDADFAGGKMRDEDGVLHKSYVRIPSPMTILFDFTNLQKIFKNNYWHKHFYYLDTQVDNISKVDAISGGYMMFKRNSFLKLGGFDERFFMYLEDVDLGLRAKKHRMSVIYCPNSEIVHVGGGSSKNKHRINYDAWDNSRKYYVKKNFKGLTKTILLIFLDIDQLLSKSKRK